MERKGPSLAPRCSGGMLSSGRGAPLLGPAAVVFARASPAHLATGNNRRENEIYIYSIYMYIIIKAEENTRSFFMRPTAKEKIYTTQRAV